MNFKERCIHVANNNNIEVEFLDDDQYQDPFEDDGTLHIMKGQIRACFDVSDGQALSGKLQNELTKKVMRELGLTVTTRVLVDETEEPEEKCCPECRRPW